MSTEPVDLDMHGQDPKQILIDALITASIVYEACLREARERRDVVQEVRAEKQLDEARNWIRILQEKNIMIAVQE